MFHLKWLRVCDEGTATSCTCHVKHTDDPFVLPMIGPAPALHRHSTAFTLTLYHILLYSLRIAATTSYVSSAFLARCALQLDEISIGALFESSGAHIATICLAASAQAPPQRQDPQAGSRLASWRPRRRAFAHQASTGRMQCANQARTKPRSRGAGTGRKRRRGRGGVS